MSTILIVILILLFLGVLPVYPYSQQWSLAPSGGLLLIIIILVILVVTGKL